jgi:hypothetical protein
MIADEIGQQRPGATVHCDLTDGDPTGRTAEFLAATWGFVADPEPREVPADPRVFAFVQPYLLARAEVEAPGDVRARAVAPSASSSTITERYADATSVPAWVAASDQWVTGERGRLTRAAATVPEDGFEVAKAYNQGAASALDEIQDMIAQHAPTTMPGGSA